MNKGFIHLAASHDSDTQIDRKALIDLVSLTSQ